MNKEEKYFGFYRGTVEQLLNKGFIKISIPGILYFEDDEGNLDISKLPPAECASTPFGGNSKNIGLFAYPELYSTVWCFFENGDLNKPIYFATSTLSSPGWNSSSVAIPEPESLMMDVSDSDDYPGYSIDEVVSTGMSLNLGESRIVQTNTINPENGEVLSTRLELSIGYSKEGIEIKSNNIDTEKGSLPGFSAMISLDNRNNKIVISSSDTIEIKAPDIILNSTEMGSKGNIKLISDDINIDATEEVKIVNDGFHVDSKKAIYLDGASDKVVYT